jgi:hypothetical protein
MNLHLERHEEIAPAVTFLFQKSLSLGQTPIDWKHAYVCPIFKKGARHEPANYRPVLLICILCKLMEHLIVSNVIKHIENNKVLTKFQHGFRSTTDWTYTGLNINNGQKNANRYDCIRFRQSL